MGACVIGPNLFITGSTYSTAFFPLACPVSGTPYCQGATTVTANNSDAFIAEFDISMVVGVGENTVVNGQFNLFPNPTEDNFVLEFNVLQPTDIQIVVYDNLGQIIYIENQQQYAGQYSNTIDLSTQATGMYMVQVSFGDQSVAQKKIKQ